MNIDAHMMVDYERETLSCPQCNRFYKSPEIGILKQAIPIVQAADELEAWLGRNAGDNCDWLVQMTVQTEEDALMLQGLLQKLHDALKPYRPKKPNESTPP